MNRRVHPQQDTQHTLRSTKKEVTPSYPQSLVQRAVGRGIQGLSTTDILQLQKTMGNAAVAQLAQGSSHGTIPTPSTSNAPIQRVKIKVAKEMVFNGFGSMKALVVWGILVKWLESLKIELNKLTVSQMMTVVYALNHNLEQAFLKWTEEHKHKVDDPKLNEELYNQFIIEVSKADPESHKPLKWLMAQNFDEIVKGGDTEINDTEGDDEETDKNFVPTIEDGDDMKDEVFEEWTKEDDLGITGLNPNVLINSEETLKKAEGLEESKKTAIENVTTSDVDTFTPTTLKNFLEKNPHLTHEKENFQFQYIPEAEKKKKGKTTKGSKEKEETVKDSTEKKKRVKREKITIKRSPDKGDTSIILESFTNPHTKESASRTVLIESEVVVTETKGRLNAPESVSELRASTAKRTYKSPIDKYRNQGFKDAQKGHIIALELGGPDVPKNIVPQWAMWQSNGLWRKMETHIAETAGKISKESEDKHSVQMRVHVYYKGSSDDKIASLQSLAFPSHFLVEMWEIDSKTKEPVEGVRYQKTLEAGQDHTDDKMMFRQDHEVMHHQHLEEKKLYEEQLKEYELLKELAEKSKEHEEKLVEAKKKIEEDQKNLEIGEEPFYILSELYDKKAKSQRKRKDTDSDKTPVKRPKKTPAPTKEDKDSITPVKKPVKKVVKRTKRLGTSTKEEKDTIPTKKPPAKKTIKKIVKSTKTSDTLIKEDEDTSSDKKPRKKKTAIKRN